MRKTVLLLTALAAGLRLAAAESPAAAAAGADWPMFHGSPALLGVAPGTLEDNPVLLWTFKTEGPVRSSPAIVSGRVFVGSSDGRLYAIDIATGKKVWAFKTEGEVEASPLVRGGRVFVGSSDGALYAVDAASGKLLWKYVTGDKILGSPNWIKAPK